MKKLLAILLVVLVQSAAFGYQPVYKAAKPTCCAATGCATGVSCCKPTNQKTGNYPTSGTESQSGKFFETANAVSLTISTDVSPIFVSLKDSPKKENAPPLFLLNATFLI
jgi:hypothetical protein